MDHVIAFYNVSKEVEPVVAQGPSAVPIEQFLHTLSRLKRALDYFERNNPKSIEVENVRWGYFQTCRLKGCIGKASLAAHFPNTQAKSCKTDNRGTNATPTGSDYHCHPMLPFTLQA